MRLIHFSVAFKNGKKRIVKWGLLFLYPPVAGLLSGGVLEYLRYLLDGRCTAGSFLMEAALVTAGVGAFLLADGLLRPFDDLPALKGDAEADTKGGDDDSVS